jgi:uncharacterized protein YbaR (Trm112 family)
MSSLDPVLLEVLACPCEHHAPVRAEGSPTTSAIVCTRCDTSFPVRDGIPVMLLDDATPGPRGIGAAPEA